MILKQSFSDFLSKISLDKTRKDRIMSAHNTVREYLEKHEEISGRIPITFLQGSYKLHTAVKPQNDGSFDVDVVLLMDLSDLVSNGKDILEWLGEILAQNGDYEDRIQPPKAHCIRLDYAKEFHMDITPAQSKDNENKGVILVANDWIESHPHGLKEYCVNKQSESNEYFYKVVKLLKWWRNIRWGDEGFPKSIVLTALVGDYMEMNAKSLDEAFFKTIQNIEKVLLEHEFVPIITNPSLDAENISASWSQEDYEQFKSELAQAVKAAKKAFESEDEQETIDLWNSEDLFRNSFPKEYRRLAEEAKSMNELMRSGQLYVQSTGILTPIAVAAKKVYPTRFYGGDS